MNFLIHICIFSTEGALRRCADKMPTGHNANQRLAFCPAFFQWLAFCPSQLFGWHFVRTISSCFGILSNRPLQMWDVIFNLVHPIPVSNSFGAARTTYGHKRPNMTKNGHFGGLLGPPGPFGRAQRDPIGPSRCEISFSILFIQYPTHLGQLGPPTGI